MKHSLFGKSHIYAIAIAVAGSAYMEVATAQLEEIVVTARKREESIQDVPISVQVFDGQFISEQGLFDIASLAPYTPNFTYLTGAGASDVYIMRGVGTHGSGIHFEPSVAQVFNGYFSTRSRMGRAALIDVAQVEVLKGPQGAILGKNTSVGAFNITSNKPTEEFEGNILGGYSFDASEGYEIEGVISGPISDNVRGRAVVNYRDIDGWTDNRRPDRNIVEQQKQDLTARFMLDVDFSDNFNGEFMYQRIDYDREGKNREVTDCLNAAGAGQGFDCELNNSNQTGNI